MVDRSATSQRVASAAAPPSTGPRKVTWAGTPEAASNKTARPFFVHHAVHKVRAQADVAVRNRTARAGRYHPAVLVEVWQEVHLGSARFITCYPVFA